MSALKESLAGLYRFVRAQGLEPPTRDVLILEVPSDVAVDAQGRLLVNRADLRTLEEFEPRFDELVGAGLPWINVSCCGLEGTRMVISIETPRQMDRTPVRLSINYSGPSRAALDLEWDVRAAIAFR